MKRLLFFLICSTAVLCLLAAPAFAAPKTFFVPATGGDNTSAIRAAFNNAIKAGPGSTVQLGPGHFYTNTIFAQGFNGTFMGAGEGRTVIDTLRGLSTGEPVVSLWPNATNPLLGYSFLFGFSGGNVNVSNMSFDITAASPALNVDGSDYLGEVFVLTGNASSSFNQVSFTAHTGNDFDYVNTDEDILIAGTPSNGFFTPISGVESVSGCSFIGAGSAGIQISGLTNGRATISGSTFDAPQYSCLVNDSSASQVTITRNQMTGHIAFPIVLWQGLLAYDFGGGLPLLPPPPAPHFLISDNYIRGLTGYFNYGGSPFLTGSGGVQVEDDSNFINGAPDRLDATIVGNTIALNNLGFAPGIAGWYADGIQVLNNRITGTGLDGIAVGTDFDGYAPGPASGWQIIGNDFSGFTPVNGWTQQYGLQTTSPQRRSGSARVPITAWSSVARRPPRWSTTAPATSSSTSTPCRCRIQHSHQPPTRSRSSTSISCRRTNNASRVS